MELLDAFKAIRVDEPQKQANKQRDAMWSRWVQTNCREAVRDATTLWVEQGRYRRLKKEETLMKQMCEDLGACIWSLLCGGHSGTAVKERLDKCASKTTRVKLTAAASAH